MSEHNLELQKAFYNVVLYQQYKISLSSLRIAPVNKGNNFEWDLPLLWESPKIWEYFGKFMKN